MPHAFKTLPGALSEMAEAENRKHSPERISALMLRLSTSTCPQLETAGSCGTAEMQEYQDPAGKPAAHARGSALAVDRGKQHHE